MRGQVTRRVHHRHDPLHSVRIPHPRPPYCDRKTSSDEKKDGGHQQKRREYERRGVYDNVLP